MNIADFSRENFTRCTSPQGFNHPLKMWSNADWLCALVGEIGEAANVVKKLNRIRDGIENKESRDELLAQLADEIADGYCYLDLIAQSRDFDLFKPFSTLNAEQIFADRARAFFDREADGATLPTASDIVCRLALQAGVMASSIGNNSSYRLASLNVLTALCALADFHDIDLAQAIRTKFDKVSAKIGYVAEVAAP